MSRLVRINLRYCHTRRFYLKRKLWAITVPSLGIVRRNFVARVLLELLFAVYIQNIGFLLQINEGVSQVSCRRASLLWSDITRMRLTPTLSLIGVYKHHICVTYTRFVTELLARFCHRKAVTDDTILYRLTSKTVDTSKEGFVLIIINIFYYGNNMTSEIKISFSIHIIK